MSALAYMARTEWFSQLLGVPCVPHAFSALLTLLSSDKVARPLVSEGVQEGQWGMSVLPASRPPSASLVTDKNNNSIPLIEMVLGLK